ncbi:MAG: hypothetical protein COA36_12830 [Desulfotalea sp.]|nr:MAG: hypothetical protein COA36_12830 [Desulfotalea sp.]
MIQDAPTENKDPIVSVINSILEHVHKKTNDLAVYSYGRESDFKKLWEYVRDPRRLKNIEEVILIASGVPIIMENREHGRGKEKTSFKSWVPVHSWIVAFFASCVETGHCLPKVSILDLDSTTEVRIDDETLLGNWFNIYYYKNCSEENKKNFIDEFVENITLENVSIHYDASMNKNSALICKSYWKRLRLAHTNVLGSAESHHSVSNQIGAMIMRCGLPIHLRPKWRKSADIIEKNTALMLEYLLTGKDEQLKREKEVTFCSNLFPIKIEEKKIKDSSTCYDEPPDILLVDDNFDKGFQIILQATLTSNVQIASRRGMFGKPDDYDENFVNENSDSNLKLLCESMKVYGEDFKLRTIGTDILFLDLRLWRPGPNNKNIVLSAYHAAAKTLLGFWEKTVTHDKPPSFYEPLRKAFNIKLSSFSIHSHRELAILPLLLAGIDPALPIVLFSSTQHRSVIQAVRNCSNIITNFAKPYLGGEDDDTCDPEIIMIDLHQAIARAIEMVKVREVWKEAVKEWEYCKFEKIRWKAGWADIVIKTSPLYWLRKTWLPLAQREEYAMAAVAPWLFLNTLLGRTRIGMLLKELDVYQEKQDTSPDNRYFDLEFVDVIYRAHILSFQSIKHTQARENAIIAALALIQLLQRWNRGEKSENVSPTQEI